MKKFKAIFLSFFMFGCASISRDCSSSVASNFGSDWIIVQYSNNGPINCWKLNDIAVDNESNTDGIYWKSNQGHLVHISGWYNRVQVTGGDFDSAAKSVGVNLASCNDGKYVAPANSVQ